ncbi:hypothetical protein [Nonomuraea salmonea]|uniref:hypothetical protein n=1 Tax=Nonomuraea salmonea TaxID=46181 RepID=UPI002FE7A643
MDWLAHEGYQPAFGARPLRRMIQRTLDNTFSRLLLNGTLHDGQRAHVGVRDDDLTITVLDPGAELGPEIRPNAVAKPAPRVQQEQREENIGHYL